MCYTLSWSILCILALLFTATASAEQVYLDQLHFDHIHFKRVEPNTIRFNNGEIVFHVSQSASFLLHAFDNTKPVHNVSFLWRANGQLNKHSVEHESSRKGDDAWIRVGLILKGEPRFPDPLVPPWVRQVRKSLKFPSDNMVYLIPDAKHAHGNAWVSPFSNKVNMISVKSAQQQDGWQAVSYNFTTPQQTIGIWLMADGDNTQSAFTSRIKNLLIK